MIEEKYDSKYRDDYFAIRAKFEQIKHTKGHTDEKLIDDADDIKFIRMSKDGETHLTVDEGKKNNILEKFMFLPSMKLKQVDHIFAVGCAGSGKTWAMNLFAQLYKMIYPNNKIIFLSLNMAEIDTSLDHKLYKIMPMQGFCDAMAEKMKNLDELKNLGAEFKDSLIIFDDIGALKSDKKCHKVFWTFIDKALEDMRKNSCSVYIIGHTSRTGNHGHILREEMTRYIIYPQTIQARNDRILTSVFGWNNKQIEEVFDTTDRFVCIDSKKRVAIYPTEIITLAELFSDI